MMLDTVSLMNVDVERVSNPFTIISASFDS